MGRREQTLAIEWIPLDGVGERSWRKEVGREKVLKAELQR
jgi:hypothetical protein